MTASFSEKDISRLVHAFYAAVRQDPLLAPIFATKIQNADWPAHMNHIIDFWSSIFLKTSRFTGSPMRKHLALEKITPAHFDRWLQLFKETATQELSPKQAEAIYIMAERIGQSFQMGLAVNFEKSGNNNHPFIDFSALKLKSPHHMN